MAAREAALPRQTSWAGRLIRNIVLWIVPVWLVWMLLTPLYNRFLIRAAENVLLLTESPNVTDLLSQETHTTHIRRRDFPPSRGLVGTVRVTDIHFHLVLLGALFLAVPGASWRERLENLGWAALIAVFFHLLLLFFWVKFVYATQLGNWSVAHFGPVARNVYGLGKHLLDLPVKLALPFILWAWFYLGRMMAEMRGEGAPAGSPLSSKTSATSSK
jgi:hypothetical protein